MSCNENVEETLLTMKSIFFLFPFYITSSSSSILRETGKAVIGGIVRESRRGIWGKASGVMGLGCEGAIYASGLRVLCKMRQKLEHTIKLPYFNFNISISESVNARLHESTSVSLSVSSSVCWSVTILLSC